MKQRPLHKKLIRRTDIWGIVFVLPSFIIFCIFAYFPMLNTLFLSLTKYNIISSKKFVGLRNYIHLFTDSLFYTSIKATAIYVIVSTLLTILIALLLALMMNREFIGRDVFRTVFFIPIVLNLVVVATIGRIVFLPYGIVHAAFRFIIPKPLPWLTKSEFALATIVIVRLWRVTGYFMVFYLAGLQLIPKELYEVADIDGITPFKKFLYITWPLLMPTTLLVIVNSFINSIKDFTIPFLLTGGGPANATKLVSVLIYQTGFDHLRMGRASAISTLLFIVIMLFTVLQLRVFRSKI